MDRFKIGPARKRRPCQDRFDLGAEDHRAVQRAIIERFFADSVANQIQPAPDSVPQRDREHSAQPREYRGTPLRETVHHDLGVGSTTKIVAERRQFTPELEKIIDLAIAHQPHGPIGVGQWLMAGRRRIDHRESGASQSGTVGAPAALMIRAPVAQHADHIGETALRAQQRRSGVLDQISGNAAH